MLCDRSNGAIHITLPENARADLDASTTNGIVTSQLPLSLQGKISQQGMEGKINGGGAPLKLRTTNGSITIEKGAAREDTMPPASVSPSDSTASGGQASVLRIQVWQYGDQKVQISVPLALAQDTLRNLPASARDPMSDKGVDLERLLQAVLKHPKLGKLVEIQDAESRVEIAIE